MNKKNIYCKGCPDFAKVYEKIKEEGLIRGSIDLGYLLKENYEFGSSDEGDNILYSGMNYWSRNRSFTKVNPHEFSIAWLGYDCLTSSESLKKDTTFCKGSLELLKVLTVCKEKDIRGLYPIDVMASNPKIEVSESICHEDSRIGFSELQIYSKRYARTEIDAHQFSILWLGYDCLKEEKKSTKVYVEGSYYVPVEESEVEPEVPLVAPIKTNFKIIL